MSECYPVSAYAYSLQAPRKHFNLELRFVHQYDEEYEEIKKTRRAGRPASTREDLLKMKISALEKEHRDGFCELFRSHFLMLRAEWLTIIRSARPHHRGERPTTQQI